MLSELYIQNVAVISKASIALSEGLNVLTGETGAGKTVLISAINAVLGERTSKDVIRSGEERAVITALFEEISPRASQMLRSLGYEDEDGSVLISREITQSGKTACKIGGIPATVAVLRQISPMLIQIHGQRDSAELLSADRHMQILDTYGELQPLLQEYRDVFQAWVETGKKRDAFQMDEAQKAQRIDMLRFQISEIESAGLDDPEEEEQLQQQKQMIRSSEKIRENLLTAVNILSGGDGTEGICSLMDRLGESAGYAAQYLAQLDPAAQRVQEMQYELEELARDVRHMLDGFSFEEGRLDAVEYRLDTIYKLKRKYGSSIQEIMAYLDQAREELDSITHAEEQIQELDALVLQQEEQVRILARQLTQKRIDAAERFVSQVEAELAFLDMPAVKLSVSREEKTFAPDGSDRMEFLIVTNAGETPKPLSKIASGGEIARIMLAMEQVMAEKNDIATLIFDEVDSGVSGRAAQKIGRKLREVSRTRQVLCVTHLAQVAAFADRHLLIYKEVQDERTFTQIAELDEAASVRELARITGGDLITEAALQSAAELRAHAVAPDW